MRLKSEEIGEIHRVVLNTHTINNLRHCINIVFILQENHINPSTCLFHFISDITFSQNFYLNKEQSLKVHLVTCRQLQ